MEKQACVTLHLPPPEIRSFDKSFPVFSIMIVSIAGFILAAFTAQKKPAAPPPITIRRICKDIHSALLNAKIFRFNSCLPRGRSFAIAVALRLNIRFAFAQGH